MTPTPSPASYANELKLGSRVIIEALGEYTSSATSIPTLILSLWYGSTGTVLAAAPAQTASASQTSNPWHVSWNGFVTAVGTAGAIYGHGILDWGTTLTAWTPFAMPTTAAARSVTIDTTILKTWGIAGTWSSTTAGNTARCDVFNVQILNQGTT